MPSDPRTVSISTSATEALGEPRFVIEHGGKIYLSVAVLEFDPGHPGIAPQQQASIAQLRTMLDSGGLRAALFEGPASAGLESPQAGMAARMSLAGPQLGIQFAQTNPPPTNL